MTQADHGAMKETKTYTATDARSKFGDLIDAAHFGERVVIRKRARCVAIVSIDFLLRAEKALEAEAAAEAAAAAEALQEFLSEGGKSLEQVERELNLDD